MQEERWTSLGTQVAMVVRDLERRRAEKRRFDRIISIVFVIQIGLAVTACLLNWMFL